LPQEQATPSLWASRPEYSLYATRDGHRLELDPATPITVKPGEEMRFALLPHLSGIKKSIGQSGSALTTCQVMPGWFYFSDGTRWAAFAGFQKPETSVPGKYVRITGEEWHKTTGTN
jgi:hypothetical protein